MLVRCFSLNLSLSAENSSINLLLNMNRGRNLFIQKYWREENKSDKDLIIERNWEGIRRTEV